MSVEKISSKTGLEDNFFDLYDDEDEDTMKNKYLSFKLGKESYGISIRQIIEIIEIQKITEVPDMPAYLKGVVNLRGKVIPVVDLRLRFHIPERPYDDRTCIIVIQLEEKNIAFIVDTVEEVTEIPDTQIEPAPSFKNTAIKDQYISGLGKAGGGVKILLDVSKIIYDKEIDTIQVSSKEKI